MPTRRAKKARKRVREEAPPANKDWLWWVIGGVLGVGFATLLWALG
jgi:drug/metabolite transporter (DMT)-like permease